MWQGGCRGPAADFSYRHDIDAEVLTSHAKRKNLESLSPF